MGTTITIPYIILAFTSCVVVVLSESTTRNIQSKALPSKKFPDLFKVEDYHHKCHTTDGSSYCMASLKLSPDNATSEFWILIEGWSNARFHYNRTVVYRKLCLPDGLNDEETRGRFVENLTNDELKPYNLSSKVFDIHCQSDYHRINLYVFFGILALYLSFITIVTIYDETLGKQQKNSRLKQKILLSFSATSSWKKITQNRNSSDFENLKSIQGIRTYQSLIIVAGHISEVLLHKPLGNTEDIEELFKIPIMQYLFTYFLFATQTYFLLSTWLLTNQVLGLYKEKGTFSIRDAFLVIIHRVTRLWPCLLVMMFFGIPLLRHFKYNPRTFEIIDLTTNGCARNWWATLFFATNCLKTYQLCNVVMWSLSIDTQCYVITTLFLYLVLKYQCNLKKCLVMAFIITYVVNAVLIYQKGLNTSSWINLKFTTLMHFMYDKKFPTIYMGFWINSSSSLMGALFGYLYFCSKDNKGKQEPYQKYYATIFITMPLLAILLASKEYSPVLEALIGPLLKPFFVFGIGTGIYGMSRRVIGGPLKILCENKYAVHLGSFTFCVYVFHFLIVFGRNNPSTTVLNLSFLDFVTAVIQDIIATWILGIIATVIIEQPGNSIRNMILPKIGGRKLALKAENKLL